MNFFSIIIPAYNEEQHLAHTLQSIENLDYPRENVETLVIENGSEDDTYKVARRFSNPTINVYSLREPNVSKARNLGLERISDPSDWIVFLDADTRLDSSFLHELNEFLKKKEEKQAVAGTTQVMPLKNGTRKANWWFKIHNFIHARTKSSFSIFIVKSGVAKKHRFDEDLSFSEDMRYLRQCLKEGNFFFLKTRSVQVSTRRFEKDGYLTLSSKWVVQSLLPYPLKKNRSYPDV